jgi:hypothetical protein
MSQSNTLFFFPWHYSPSGPRPTSMYISVHVGFSRSYTFGRTPWAGDQFVARPLPVHKHRETHTHKLNIHALRGITLLLVHNYHLKV